MQSKVEEPLHPMRCVLSSDQKGSACLYFLNWLLKSKELGLRWVGVRMGRGGGGGASTARYKWRQVEGQK